MNRAMQIFNFLGVCVLAVLCAAQWRINRQVNLRAVDLQRTVLNQTDRLSEQDRTIKQDGQDLDDFRQRLEISESALSETQSKLATAAAQRDQLRASLNQWMEAVAQRDAALKLAGQEIQKLAQQRNDAIEKFNDLAAKYNAMVKEMGAGS